MTDDDMGIRLVKIRQKVLDLIEEYAPDEIIFEDIQLQGNVINNVDTFKKLAEVFGIIYELATEIEIPNSSVLASTWKSAIGIGGKYRPEQKRNAQAWVKETYGLSVSEDEADAVCIGAYASGIRKPKGKVVKRTADPVFDWS